MKKFLVTMAVAAIATPMFAQATQQRVAIIDVQRVLTQSTAGKATAERLKKLREDQTAKAKAMEEELRKLDADINSKRLSLSAEKLAEMQKQLSDRQINMQRFGQDADRDFGVARDRELAALDGKIQPVIDALAKEMGIAAVFNKFESGLVWASDAIDITDTVIKRFNDASAAAAPAK